MSAIMITTATATTTIANATTITTTTTTYATTITTKARTTTKTATPMCEAVGGGRGVSVGRKQAPRRCDERWGEP